MGFLHILEDNKLPHVPATVILDHDDGQSGAVASGLKHGKGRYSHVVLVPQPSDDPNDPLNWPQTKKITAVLVIALGSCLFASVIGGLLNSGLVVVAEELGRPIAGVALIAGYQLLVAGSTGAFTSALSRKYGKRPVFLVSSFLGFIGSIIGSTTNSYGGLLAARIVQGGSTAAYEGIVFSLVGDLFFVHERGIWLSVLQFALGAVSMFTNVITGPITTNLGWKWLFHLCIVFCGLQLLLVFFFVPETQYNRDQRLNIDETLGGELDMAEKSSEPETSHVEGKDGNAAALSSNAQPVPTTRTFVQQLAVFTEVYTTENLLQLIIAPFVSCTNLVALWVILTSGTITATYVAQTITLAQIFAAPPYLQTPTGIGNIFLGPFIGCVIATALVAFLNDSLMRYCARKNNGIYEPEYRLLLAILGVTAGIGLMLFGYLCQIQASLYAAATAYGLDMFGITIINVAVCSYGLDAYRDMSSDVFAGAIIYKNFLFYGFTWFVNDWMESAGPATVFYVFGGVTFGILITTPLIFFFGKKYRSFWARHNVLELLHIKPHRDV